MGKNWFDHYLAQDDIDKVKDVFQSTIQGDIEVIENFENSILRSDGTKRLIAFHNSVLQNEDGNIIGVFSSGEDITDRRQAELELLQSKETAERYLNIAAEIIVTLDREGKITQINTSGRELMGYQPGELIGKDWVKSSLPPVDQPSFQKLYSSLMAGEVEGNESVQGKLVTRTGEVKDILWHNALLRDEDGSITGLLSSGEDITKLTKVLEELTQSQEQISRLNEAARKVHDLYERNKIFQTIGDEIANLGFDVAIFATSEDRAELEPVYFSYDDNLEHFSAKNILRHNQFKMSLTTDTYLKPIMQNQETVLATIGSRELKAMLPGIQKLAVKFLKEFLKTAIYAPLVVQGETTGLVVVSKVGLMEKDVPPIAAFAHQASAALRNARYAADLSQRAQELERLTALISEAEESERKRLAQELHDQVGQSLALLGFNLSQNKRYSWPLC